MKRYCIILWAVTVLAVLLTSCTQQENPATGGGGTSSATGGEKETGTTTTSQTTTPSGVGGDEWDYSRSYSIFFSIESRMQRLVDKEEYDAWRNTFDRFDAGGTRKGYEYNVYTLIHEFSIPREQVEFICEDYEKKFPDDIYFTDEQVEVLYTGTELEVYQYFANPYAVMVGKEAYSPKWLATHTAAEYREVGITYEILNAVLEAILSVCPTDVERDHIRTQLAALA